MNYDRKQLQVSLLLKGLTWMLQQQQFYQTLKIFPLSISLKVSTAEDNGILLYNGDNDHIAVELYQGHVKVSYDPGSQPGHAIYRYGATSPLKAHLISDSQVCSRVSCPLSVFLRQH